MPQYVCCIKIPSLNLRAELPSTETIPSIDPSLALTIINQADARKYVLACNKADDRAKLLAVVGVSNNHALERTVIFCFICTTLQH